MRYPASEKAEIIRLVEQSHLPVRRTLGRLGIPRATVHRWYDLYQRGGPEALGDRSPRPGRIWNRIPEEVRGQIIALVLADVEAQWAGPRPDELCWILGNVVVRRRGLMGAE